jgi:hypothetical protein
VFPSQTLSIDPRVGVVRRHHVSDSVIQKAVKAAALTAKIHKPVSVHTLRSVSTWYPPFKDCQIATAIGLVQGSRA